MAADKYLKITLVRSPIGYKKNQRVTAHTLGLRKLNATVVHRATPQIVGMVNQISHLLSVEEVAAPAAEKTPEAPAKKAKAAPVKAKAEPAPEAEQEDNLTKIEGIGPKMSAALKAAGITTFAKLAASDEATLRSAIEAAGMSLSPSLQTWAEQASYAANGDWEGLKQLQSQLVGGRRV